MRTKDSQTAALWMVENKGLRGSGQRTDTLIVSGNPGLDILNII